MFSTQTKTITAVVSAVDTVTVTTSTTATVATTTLLFTESTTTTASTATNTILQTTSITVTTTDIQTAPAITTSVFSYAPPGAKMMARSDHGEVVARGNNPWGIPDYAWPACQDWDHYIDACKCFGINPITVTKKASTTTVTVTASNAITTTVSTLTTTTTNTVPVTATTSATFTAVIEVIASVTTTQTVTDASAVTISTTTTPTVTSTLSCKPTGVPFRAAQAAGDPRRLAVVGGGFVAWIDFGPSGDPFILQATTLVLDNNGFLELLNPQFPGDPDQALYIDLTAGGSTATEQVFADGQPAVEAGAPNFVRIKGCINPITNVLYLSADGRNNILNCQGGGAFLSTGNGLELSGDCVVLTPVTEDPPAGP